MTTKAEIEALMAVGDIINVKGPSVPSALLECFWRVEAIDADGTVTLSKPYIDAEATVLFDLESHVAELESVRLDEEAAR